MAKLEPVPHPSASPRTRVEVLEQRLEHIRQLKRHYTDHYGALMERIPVLAASLQYAQHAVLLSAPDKRPKKGADGSAASKPPPGRSNGNTGLLPLGPAVDNATAEGTEQKVGRPDSPRRAAPPLPSFSDAEEDAVDVLCVDAPQATADTLSLIHI